MLTILENTTKDGIKTLENIIKKHPIPIFVVGGVILVFFINRKDKSKKEVVIGSLPQVQDFGNLGSGGASFDIPNENIDSDSDSDTTKILGIDELRDIIQNQIDKNIKTQHKETIIDTSNYQNDDFETQLTVENEKRNMNYVEGIVPRVFNNHSKVSAETKQLIKSATNEQKNIINRAYNKLKQQMQKTGKSVEELVGRAPTTESDRIRREARERFSKIPTHTERKIIKRPDGTTKRICTKTIYTS